MRGREDFRFDTTIVDEFTGRISNANQLGPREHGRRAVTHLTIELATDHEHRVGVRHRSGPHRADDPWMISWHKAAALPRIETDGAKRVEKANDLRSGFASAVAGHYYWSLRQPECFNRLLANRWIGWNDARLRPLDRFLEDQVRRDMSG